MATEAGGDRRGEWFVPSFGPLKFRIIIGLLFLPYTGMVLAFTVIGAMMAEIIHWDRVGAVILIYFLALGVGAHALDALGNKGVKPWGTVLSKGQLWALAIVTVTLAYAIGIYYMLQHAPLLWLIAIPEGFFLLAYNLEWFKGRFHTDAWFAFSWGSLPVLAGYILQTNRIDLPVLLMAASMGLLSLVEIKASRPYKLLRRQPTLLGNQATQAELEHLEGILKSISFGVMLMGASLLSWRLLSP